MCSRTDGNQGLKNVYIMPRLQDSSPSAAMPALQLECSSSSAWRIPACPQQQQPFMQVIAMHCQRGRSTGSSPELKQQSLWVCHKRGARFSSQGSPALCQAAHWCRSWQLSLQGLCRRGCRNSCVECSCKGRKCQQGSQSVASCVKRAQARAMASRRKPSVQGA